MTKIELFKKLIAKAKHNGYQGPDYDGELGFILDGTNCYALIFREDFAKAIWGEISGHYQGASLINPKWKSKLQELVVIDDKWKYLEENTSDLKF